MASLLLKGVHERLGLPSISSISCSSADATSVVASNGGSSSRFIDRHSPRLRDPHRSSTSKPPRSSFSGSDNGKDPSASSSPKSNSNQQHGHGTKKKKSTAPAATSNGRRSLEKKLVSPATSSRFLLNSSRMQSEDLGLDILAFPPPPPPPPSFIDVFPAKDAPLPAWPVRFPDEKPSVMQLVEPSSSGTSSSA